MMMLFRSSSRPARTLSETRKPRNARRKTGDEEPRQSKAFGGLFGTQRNAWKKVLIIGDILHSRVARSNSSIMKKLGVELCDAVMDYERSLINDQVENGIAARMAVLYYLRPE
jgi:hypothetical protein